MFLSLPDRAVLGILLAGDKQGMCPLILSAGVVPVLENSEPIFVDDKRERVQLLLLRCLSSVMAGWRMEKFGYS